MNNEALQRLATEAKARADKATPGPWVCDEDGEIAPLIDGKPDYQQAEGQRQRLCKKCRLWQWPDHGCSYFKHDAHGQFEADKPRLKRLFMRRLKQFIRRRKP